MIPSTPMLYGQDAREVLKQLSNVAPEHALAKRKRAAKAFLEKVSR